MRAARRHPYPPCHLAWPGIGALPLSARRVGTGPGGVGVTLALGLVLALAGCSRAAVTPVRRLRISAVYDPISRQPRAVDHLASPWSETAAITTGSAHEPFQCGPVGRS